MRLHTRLEEIQTLWAVRIGSYFLTTRVSIGWHVVDKRHNVTQELHQALNSHVFMRIDTEDGKNAARNKALANTHSKLIFCKWLVIKKLFHELVIILCCCLNEVTM